MTKMTECSRRDDFESRMSTIDINCMNGHQICLFVFTNTDYKKEEENLCIVK